MVDLINDITNGIDIKLCNYSIGDLLCKFTFEDYSIYIEAKSKNFIDSECKINLTSKSKIHNISMDVLIKRSGDFDFNGIVKNCLISDTKINESLINRITYVLSGLHSRFNRVKSKWSREYVINDLPYIVDYTLLGDRIQANILSSICFNNSEKLSKFIEDEIFVICLMYSFCNSNKVEWVSRYISKDDTIILFEHIHSSTKNNDFNEITPFRSDVYLFQYFMTHVIDNKYKKCDLIKDKIYPVICNLQWNAQGFREWDFISLVASLEGFCKKKENIISHGAFKKIKKEIKKTLILNNIDNEQIFINIDNNEKIINGYPVKVQIDNKLKELNLNLPYNINELINIRNKIVHEGWHDGEFDCISKIEEIRNVIFLLLFSYFEYKGDFYLFNNSNKDNLSNYEK